MTWSRATVAEALAGVLFAAAEGAVSTFADPPATFNVPAMIVGWPQSVTYHRPAFGIDEVTIPVIVAAGLSEPGKVDDLLRLARTALEADPTLGGVLAFGGLTVDGGRNWRALLDVGGGQYLAADLMLTVHQ